MWSPNLQTKTKHNHNDRTKSSSSSSFFFAGGILFAVLLIYAVSSFFSSTVNENPSFFKFFTGELKAGSEFDTKKSTTCDDGLNRVHDPPDPTFYDDPEMSYTIGKPVKNWDEKRKQWLKLHPSFAHEAPTRILMVTGSQTEPCKNPIGDYLLLRLFKNKVDYCRIHGYDIFYNNVLFQPKMFSYWAKTPVIKAAMLAHPEAEWIWWVDSDAAFTDMDFKVPLDRYKGHNMVVHGWPKLVEERSWTSVNAGVFLLRNCQWSMDFMEVWAQMGPQTKDYDKWGSILRSTFKDKLYPESDDQSGLIYLLLKEKEKWGNKVYVEGEYYLEGYWMEIVGNYDNITDRYLEIEKKEEKLRRRHAEVVSESFAKVREVYLKDAGYAKGSWRRPFITHFTGCQPCSGTHNKMYSGDNCWDGMQQALNFADNQVLKNYGFVHRDLLDSSTALPLPFDYLA